MNMEILNANESNITSTLNGNTMENNNWFEISSNWVGVAESRKIENAISYQLKSDFPLRMTLDDIVDEKRSLEIKPRSDDKDDCQLDIKMNDKYKIVQLGVVSEASLLEIFRDAGEYALTTYAEFIDDFEDASVYFAEVIFDQPVSEAGIKFKRIRNKNRNTMFLYGIRIIIEEVTVDNSQKQLLDFNLIDNVFNLKMNIRKKFQNHEEKLESHINKIADSIFGTPLNHQQNQTINNNKKEDQIKKSVDNKKNLENELNLNTAAFEASVNIRLQQMEQRLMNRIEQFEENTNRRFNDIISLLEVMIKNPS